MNTKDYIKQLNYYSFEESIDKSQKYMEDYWLNEKELKEKWLPIKDKIFNANFDWFPEKVFNDDFILRPIMSGSVLIDLDYDSLIKCIEFIGDSEYVVVESHINNFIKNAAYDMRKPALRFKFNSGLKWSDISFSFEQRERISQTLFEPVRNYFVFGQSGEWGKFTANDHDDMVDIIGFKPKYLDLFRKYFPVTEQEKKDIEDSLSEYKDQIVW